ncbi:DHA2 family efflux MFS transporter permease subunit [Compostibacter hankyongensis]|uniref:MDR family MFS transporter n=1 Tax=Compostibacter hankyongensis TaxID=1007089 RepID=A0ABP8FUE0_9BACT
MAEKGIRKWIVTFTVITASLLELIDTTIVNVSLPDIMGNLGATLDSVGWVVTAYAVANVIILPMSGWLGNRFGRKNYFLFSIIAFTVFSFFCGNATSLGELILFRVLQGLAGGGLLSTSQAILMETWPPEEIGVAMALFGLGAVVGPTVGPTIGGYINDHFSWPWIFFVNLPVGALASFCVITFVRPTPKTGNQKPVDWWGILLLAVSVGCLQTVLEKGEREDWFAATYIIVLSAVAVIGGLLFVWRELSTDHPVVDFRILRYRNFAIGLFTTFILGLGLYGSVFVFPILCQNILGFTAEQTGLILFPGGLATIVMMPLIGTMLKKNIPAQFMATAGFLVFFVFCMQMIRYTNGASGTGDFFWPLIIRGVGMSMLFVPLTTLAVQDLRGADIGQGTGLNNMMRQLGGSFGIALITTFLDRRMFYHRNMLIEHINPYNSAYTDRFNGIMQGFISKGYDSNGAARMAHQAIDGAVMKQTALLSYGDVFWIVGMFFLFVIPLLYLQKFKKGGGAMPAGAH